MDIQDFAIKGLKLIIPKRFSDTRGYVQETWSARLYREQIGDMTFVQDNLSLSLRKGTLRGLHFQQPPYAQGKLVRVGRGSIFDVAVDIRKGSPTYCQHLATTLDAAQAAQLWIPSGFLHGFCTLEENTEVCYKATSYYNPTHDAGVLWMTRISGSNGRWMRPRSYFPKRIRSCRDCEIYPISLMTYKMLCVS